MKQMMKAMGLCLALAVWSVSANARMGCEAGMWAFQKTLYPVLRAKCIACHDDMGIGPAHASSNVEVAYPIALVMMNFSDFQDSLFVKKVAAKHWLNYDDKSEGIAVSELTPHLQAWWDEGEVECEVTYAYKSSATQLPKDLPTRAQNKYKTMEWDMGDCKLSVDIQEFAPISESNLGAYRVKAPRMSCRQPKHVEGLRFFVGGQTEIFENIYDDLAMDIPASSDMTSLSSQGMILMRRSGEDTLSFGFRMY